MSYLTRYEPPDQQTLDKRIKRLDMKGNHLWVIMASWAVSVPDMQSLSDADVVKVMDRENLIVFGGPMCFKCEQVYSERIAKRTCHGRIDK